MPFSSVARGRLQASLACGGTLLLLWRIPNPGTLALAGSAFALAVLAWSAPARYAPVQRAMERTGRVLLMAFTWCALGVVYFGLLTPMRLWGFISRKDPLQLRARPRDATSTFLRPLPAVRRDHFERQF